MKILVDQSELNKAFDIIAVVLNLDSDKYNTLKKRN